MATDIIEKTASPAAPPFLLTTDAEQQPLPIKTPATPPAIRLGIDAGGTYTAIRKGGANS